MAKRHHIKQSIVAAIARYLVAHGTDVSFNSGNRKVAEAVLRFKGDQRVLPSRTEVCAALHAFALEIKAESTAFKSTYPTWKVRKTETAKRESKLTYGNKPPKAEKGFYWSDQWRALRYKALKASRGVCELCGEGPIPGKPLHVDHIKPRSKHPELELDLSNLQVLCFDCNLGKSNTDEVDWRVKELPPPDAVKMFCA